MTDKEKDQEELENENNANGGGTDRAVQFSQEQLDAIVKDRLERARTKTTSDLLSQLGIEDIDEAKKAIEDATKAKEAQMSELEKAQAQITDALNQAAQAKADMKSIQAKADEALLKAAIISKAQNFNDPMDAWQFIDKSKIEIGEDGSYSGINKALEALTESKPYLIKLETNGNVKSGTPTRPTPKTVAEKLLAQNQTDKPKTAEELRPNISF
jgi:DNA repair exonuclease SbcCD ATPase subunit